MDPPASLLREMPHLCEGINETGERAANIISAVVGASKLSRDVFRSGPIGRTPLRKG